MEASSWGASFLFRKGARRAPFAFHGRILMLAPCWFGGCQAVGRSDPTLRRDLCSRSIDRDQSPPHPLSPSIDLRAAHWLCNIEKGDQLPPWWVAS